MIPLQVITLYFEEFVLENDAGCNSDVFMLQDGPEPLTCDPYYCLTACTELRRGYTWSSTTNAVVLDFTSDEAATAMGFRIVYVVSDPVLNEEEEELNIVLTIEPNIIDTDEGTTTHGDSREQAESESTPTHGRPREPTAAETTDTGIHTTPPMLSTTRRSVVDTITTEHTNSAAVTPEQPDSNGEVNSNMESSTSEDGLADSDVTLSAESSMPDMRTVSRLLTTTTALNSESGTSISSTFATDGVSEAALTETRDSTTTTLYSTGTTPASTPIPHTGTPGLGFEEVDQGVCGYRYVPLIFGGEDVLAHSWPWQGLMRGTEDGSVTICGASLVDHHWAITAAHCV